MNSISTHYDMRYVFMDITNENSIKMIWPPQQKPAHILTDVQ